jgi:hypothetical protein
MKTKLIIVVGLFLFLSDMYSQENIFFECGTLFDSKDTVNLPHYGQNIILDHILDITMKRNNDLKSSNIDILTDNFPFHIPVKIWVYHDDNGSNAALSSTDVFLLFDEVNRQFAENNTGIQFYMKCGIAHINSTKFNTIDNDKEFDEMIKTYHEQYALNLHLIYNHAEPGWGGRGVFPWENNNFRLAVKFRGKLNDVIYPHDYERKISTTVHEIGHCLGILHTHENMRGKGFYNGDATNCYQESVSRTRTQGIGCVSTIGKKKCEINGDALCDTEASPNSDKNKTMLLTGSCDYFNVSGSTDNWGDKWKPPTKNFMSYIDNNYYCISEFTSGQIAVMHIYIILYMNVYNPPYYIPRDPWYNLHSISLSGTVNSGEKESYIVPQRVEAAKGSNTYTINSGGAVNLYAGERISLKPGFRAKAGSTFTAKVGNLTGCSNILPGTWQRGDSDITSDEGISQEDIDKCLEIITKALNREYWNYDIDLDNLDDEEQYLDDDLDDDITIFSFEFYPNPAKDFITVDYTLFIDASISIELYNSAGQMIKLILPQQKLAFGDYCLETSVSDLSTGTYYIKVSSCHQVETKQLIINN